MAIDYQKYYDPFLPSTSNINYEDFLKVANNFNTKVYLPWLNNNFAELENGEATIASI